MTEREELPARLRGACTVTSSSTSMEGARHDSAPLITPSTPSTAPKAANQTLTAPDELRATYDVLRRAQSLAGSKWHAINHDLHRCLLVAWQETGTDTRVPFASLTRACRALIPGGNLMAWSEAEGRTRREVTELLGRAARGLIARSVA